MKPTKPSLDPRHSPNQNPKWQRVPMRTRHKPRPRAPRQPIPQGSLRGVKRVGMVMQKPRVETRGMGK
eukprot:1685464-Prorocentrum_lima.AAC.1